MYDYTCQKCGGLVAEPMKAYGYSGQFCRCEFPVRPKDGESGQVYGPTVQKPPIMDTPTPDSLRDGLVSIEKMLDDGYKIYHARAGQIFPRAGWYIEKLAPDGTVEHIVYLDTLLAQAREDERKRGDKIILKWWLSYFKARKVVGSNTGKSLSITKLFNLLSAPNPKTMSKKKFVGQELSVHMGLFDFKVNVFVGDYRAACAYAKWKFDEKDLDLEALDFGYEPLGKCFFRTGYCPIVWVPRRPRGPRETATLAHECLHAVFHLFEWAALPLTRDTEEVMTHSMAHLVTSILTKLK